MARITLSSGQFRNILVSVLAAMGWRGAISRVPGVYGTKDVLRIKTVTTTGRGHCDVSRVVIEDIFNEYEGDERFVKAYEYIKHCTETAVIDSLKNCYDVVVGPYDLDLDVWTGVR